MTNRYVDFVSDEHFLKCVKHVCDGYFQQQEHLDIDKLKDNGLDIFKIIFDMANRNVGFENWLKNEENRQLDKSLNNRIGEFHQKLLGGVSGWKDLGIGDETKLDLIKNDNKMAMELKNKFNTVNADSLSEVRNKIEKFRKKNPKATVYWAYIIEKDNSSGEKVWVYKKKNNPNIKKAWGSRVYEIVTKDKDSLEKTWKALPKAIEQVLGRTFVIQQNDRGKLVELFRQAFR